MKKFLIYFLFLFSFNQFVLADNTYFIDFNRVLNQSKAGEDAQQRLKIKFESESKKFSAEEENLRKQESELISQKKALSNEDYQKKVDELRKKVAKLQSDKQNSLNEIAKSRAQARQELLKNLNPIDSFIHSIMCITTTYERCAFRHIFNPFGAYVCTCTSYPS